MPIFVYLDTEKYCGPDELAELTLSCGFNTVRAGDAQTWVTPAKCPVVYVTIVRRDGVVLCSNLPKEAGKTIVVQEDGTVVSESDVRRF